MGLWQEFPYPDYHNLNLDWMIKEVQEVRVKVDGLVSEVQAMIDGAEKKFEAQFQLFRNEINQTISELNITFRIFTDMELLHRNRQKYKSMQKKNLMPESVMRFV